MPYSVNLTASRQVPAILARTSLATAASPATRPVSWGHQASAHEGHIAAVYLLGAEVVGLVWYLLYLRSRIVSKSAGIYRQEVVEPEKLSASSPAIR